MDFVTFDVKYMSLIAGSIKQLDYAYSFVHKGKWTKQAQVYLLMFESIPSYLAIVPKSVYEGSSDFAYGTLPLVGKIPRWCQPFMVADEHLAQAI